MLSCSGELGFDYHCPLDKEVGKMTLMRWDPFRDLSVLRDRMNRLLDESGLRSASGEGTSGWWPPVDIFEKEDSIVLEAEIPGVLKEDIDINIENNNLTLRGEKRHEVETREQDYYRIERQAGSFVRTFNLPATIQRDRIVASLKDGILRVILPKAEEAKPKKVDIKVE
jgi:HSP20 family protein